MKIMNLIFGLILLTACSDNKTNYTVEEVNGIKVYKNTNTPAKPDLKINLQELFSIKSFDESFADDSARVIQDMSSIAVDSEDNIFILSSNKATVFKFNSNGSFIKSFGRMGDGPGESKWPQNMYIQNDTVHVLNQTVLRMNKYDTDGKFLFSVSTGDCKMPIYTKPLGNDRIVTYFCNWRYENNGMFMDYDLGIADAKYNEVKRIKMQTFEGERVQSGYIDPFFGFAVTEKEVFVADNSVEKYHIDVFDHNGELLYSIKKPFRKLRASKSMTEASKGNVIFKKAVTDLLTDSDGRLWAFVSTERIDENENDFIVDIFKDGVYLNRVKIDIGVNTEPDWMYGQIFIKRDRLYVSDPDNSVLKVFQYQVYDG